MFDLVLRWSVMDLICGTNTLEFSLLQHPSLEGRCTPWVNAQESRHHPILLVANADKLAAAFKDLVGRFLRYRDKIWLSFSARRVPPLLALKQDLATQNIFSEK